MFSSKVETLKRMFTTCLNTITRMFSKGIVKETQQRECLLVLIGTCQCSLFAIRHEIQNSTEAILLANPSLFTEFLGWLAIYWKQGVIYPVSHRSLRIEFRAMQKQLRNAERKSANQKKNRTRNVAKIAHPDRKHFSHGCTPLWRRRKQPHLSSRSVPVDDECG